MDILQQIGDKVALYYQTNTELALWLTIGIVAAVIALMMLAWPGFRRFIAVVIVISLVLGALLVNFAEEVARGL